MRCVIVMLLDLPVYDLYRTHDVWVSSSLQKRMCNKKQCSSNGI